ncbi:MAG TPA: fumarylacetoacetate hydrolase family protein [Gemmatimonadaceae bacterium]|jgi:2-keto-4-pentenoate hydratase/2-oxohepta-3-ene-1,7-dioic acid hydratase in catechol pathway|nr:fumarylacetoacetate hydrolase family protein [Gemmatimonadaceae bacterium]
MTSTFFKLGRRASRPGKIVCIGRNYREHAKELGNEVPTEPLFFLKPSSSVIGDGDAIILPPQSQQVEFEGEIGVLIGRSLTRASESDVESAIAGILAVNDVTARDLQRKDSQWTRAKGFDTFCPIGPVSQGSPFLENLTVITRVNGEEKQRASSSEMVFSINSLLSYVSHVMTLEPGDIVATGTPSGVGPLKPGDIVEVEIPGVSKVSNPVESRT